MDKSLVWGLTCALWDVYQYPWPEYLPSFDNCRNVFRHYQMFWKRPGSGAGGEWVGRQTASGSISLTQRVLNFSSSISLLLCVCVCVCTHGLYTCLTFIVDMDIFYITLDITLVTSGHQSFGHQGGIFVEDNLLTDQTVGGWLWGWFKHILFIVPVIYYYYYWLQLHSQRLSGIRSWRLGTPALSPSKFMVSYTLEV